MSESGYFNRAARRSGGDRALLLGVACAGNAEAHDLLMTAADMGKMAKENDLTPEEVVAEARKIGYLTCSDEDAKWLEDFISH